MDALPSRLCLGTKRKFCWFWALVAGSIIFSALYMSNSGSPTEAHLSRHHLRTSAKRIESRGFRPSHIPEVERPSSTLNNSTELRREKERALTQLLPRLDGGGATREGRCRSPRNSVFMVKTHKCSSSTLQSILLRRAEDLRLRVALPRGGVYLSWGPQFNRGFIFQDDGVATYNIMASHMHLHEWDFGAIKEVMADDAVWITILRDPAKQYESLYTYYGWQANFGVDLHRFLENPPVYYPGRERQAPNQAGRNPMLYDNGLDARYLEFGDPRVSDFITAMGRRFDLVLLADFFDESLILLKEMMCWELDDIAYISQNARPKDSVESLSEAEIAAIRRWNWGDYLLYDYFKRMLLSRISSFGIGRMSEELVRLHRRKAELAADCILETLDSGDERVWYPRGMKVTSVRANPDARNPRLCEQLSRPELVFLERMREHTALGHQRKPAANSSGKNSGFGNTQLDLVGAPGHGGEAGDENLGETDGRNDARSNPDEGKAGGNNLVREVDVGGAQLVTSGHLDDGVQNRSAVPIAPVRTGGGNDSGTTGQRRWAGSGNLVNTIRAVHAQENKENSSLSVKGGEEMARNITVVDLQAAGAKVSKSQGINATQQSKTPAEAERRGLVASPVGGSEPLQGVAEGGGTCQPLDGLVMIKTHKCSSSTLQNILLRRAEDRALEIALPRQGVYFHQQSKFSRVYIHGDDRRRHYDMMASHMKFDIDHFEDIRRVMKSNVRYITILRDPATQYESMYTYYHYEKRFGVDLHTFLKNPRLYFPSRENRRIFQAGRNPMCHDNGLDARFLEPGDAVVDRFVESLEGIHDLVLLAEYFDISLILLKDLMCWTLDDIVYFKQNARSAASVALVTQGEQAAIREWNWADRLLYDHFNRTLWRKVATYGAERMTADVAALQARNAQLADDCVAKTLDHGDHRVWYPPGVKVSSFLVNQDATNPRLCDQLTRPELGYLQRLRESSSSGARNKG